VRTLITPAITTAGSSASARALWICFTRYGSAADIRHYLADEPITARPPSHLSTAEVRASKQALVIGVAAVFVVLVAGVVACTWEAVKAQRAETQAKQQTASAQAVNAFLQNDLLGQASAYN
jgi:hypothetical protein